MRSVTEIIFKPHWNIWIYCPVVGIVTLAAHTIASLAMGFLLYASGANLDAAIGQPPTVGPVAVLFAVIFAPVAETLVLAALLGVLLRLRVRPGLAAVTAAIGFASLHVANPIAMAGIFAGFLVMSCAYIAWREVTIPKALLAAGVPHAIFNVVMSTVLRSGA